MTDKVVVGNCELYLGDCLSILPTLEAGSVDLTLTDPPYLVTDLSFDSELEFEWIDELLRIVKRNGYFVSFGLFEIQQAIRARGWVHRFSGIWLKEKGGMRTHSAKMPMCQHEPWVVYAYPGCDVGALVWNPVCRDGEPYRKVQRNLGYKRGGKDQLDRANTSSWTETGYVSENSGERQMTDVLYGPTKGCMRHIERTEHPTQKPLDVFSVQIEWLTNPGDTILDPFMGSGTTGVACVQTGRNFIGIEIDESYFNIARKRIEEAQMQPLLFT